MADPDYGAYGCGKQGQQLGHEHGHEYGHEYGWI